MSSGTVSTGGVVSATILGVLLVPVFFVVIARRSDVRTGAEATDGRLRDPA